MIKRRMLAALLAVALTVCLLPAGALAATPPALLLGGVGVNLAGLTANNCVVGGNAGAGSARTAADTALDGTTDTWKVTKLAADHYMLTLNNAMLLFKNDAGIRLTQNWTLQLEGASTVSVNEEGSSVSIASSTGVRSDGALTVEGTGSLTAIGGRASQYSYGVYAENLTVKSGRLDGTANPVNGDGRTSASAGVCVNDTLTVTGGAVYGAGDSIDASDVFPATVWSAGVNATEMIITGGSVTGLGGTAAELGDSSGVSATALTVKGGTVTGTGGEVTGSGCSCGVSVTELTAEDGSVTGTSGLTSRSAGGSGIRATDLIVESGAITGNLVDGLGYVGNRIAIEATYIEANGGEIIANGLFRGYGIGLDPIFHGSTVTAKGTEGALNYPVDPAPHPATASENVDGTGAVPYDMNNYEDYKYFHIAFTPLAAPARVTWNGAVPAKAEWSAVANAAGYHLQLCKDGIPMGAAVRTTELTHDFTSAMAAGGEGRYTVRVMATADGYRNSPKKESASPLNVIGPIPYIQSPARDTTRSVTVGETATFAVIAANAMLYQWFVNRNDGRGFVEIRDANEASYTTSAATLENDGFRYYCIVTDDGVVATSPIFTLRVTEAEEEIPKTGDPASPWLWAGVLLLALAGLAATALLSRRGRFGTR